MKVAIFFFTELAQQMKEVGLKEVYPITSTGFSGGVLDLDAVLGDEVAGPLGLREDCGAVTSTV